MTYASKLVQALYSTRIFVFKSHPLECRLLSRFTNAIERYHNDDKSWFISYYISELSSGRWSLGESTFWFKTPKTISGLYLKVLA